MLRVTMRKRGELKPNPNNPRTHSKAQIRQIADSIRAFGFAVPLLVDPSGQIIAGHGRYAAATLLGLEEVPTIELDSLSDAKRRALALADNRIPAGAGWDREMLHAELQQLAELLPVEELTVEVTGFSVVEIDQLEVDFEERSADPADELEPLADVIVSRPGDVWMLGPHRLICGDSRNDAVLKQLMGGTHAAMAFMDPPYNVKIESVVGRGRLRHEEFAMASGEMAAGEFVQFLRQSLERAASHCRSGALNFVCMDWRHIRDLIEAGAQVYDEFVNLIAWVKSNAGQGSFYRSQHELIGVFRVGSEPHLNNVQLGRHGRTRSNVWTYAGVNGFRSGRLDELKLHPTVKPIAMVCDAMRDCTRRGDAVLDTFCGSGTTILAAERVGRVGYGVELEAKYVDCAVRRWQAFTKKDAIHADLGGTFEEVASARQADVGLRRAA